MESLANVLSQFHSWPLITTPPTQNTHMPRFLFTLLVLNLSSIKTGSTSPGHFDHAVMALVETPNRDAKGTPCRHRVGRSWSVEQGDMEEVYMNNHSGQLVLRKQCICVYTTYVYWSMFSQDAKLVSNCLTDDKLKFKNLKLSQSVEWCKKKHAVEIGVYCLCNPSNYNH